MNLLNNIRSLFTSRSGDTIEQRDAITPASWMSLAASGGGSPYTDASGMAQAPVVSGMTAISDAVASMQLVDYTKSGGYDKRNEGAGNYNYLFNVSVGNGLNAYSFKRRIISDIFEFGNSFWQIVRAGNRVNLIPYDPANVVMEAYEGYTYARYTYNGQEMDMANVLHFMRYPDKTVRGLWGAPIWRVGREALKKTHHVGEFQNGFFNGGGNQVVFTPNTSKDFMPDALVKSAKSDYLNQTSPMFGGNPNGVVFMSQPFTALQVTRTARDAMMLEMADWSVDEVSRIMRIPPSILYKSGGGNGNVEEEQNRFFWHAIQPICEMIECELQAKLYTPQEYGKRHAEFDYSSILKTDIRSKAELLSKAFNMGAMSPNDVADALGMTTTDIEGSDMRFVLQNAQPIDMLLNNVKAGKITDKNKSND